MSVASWYSTCFCVVLCVCFCIGHFVVVPLNLTCLHCLQHSFFEHQFINARNKKFNYTYDKYVRFADFQSVLPIPIIPDAKTLKCHKIQRIKNHQLTKMFSQLALYSALLYTVYTISYESRDERSFLLKHHMATTFKYVESVRMSITLLNYTHS